MQLSNRSTRILISIISIPAILLITYIGNFAFLLFALTIDFIALYELKKLARHKGIELNYYLTVIISAAVILNFYFLYFDFLVLFLLSVLIILLFELFRNRGSALLNTSAALFSVFYLSLFIGTLVGIREIYNYNGLLYEQGAYILIAMFVTVWICDSAAYFIGSALGRYKLFPRVSPNKTWEGAIAGFVFAIITIIAARSLILDFLSITDALVIGFIIGVLGQIGDLVESLFKRDAGIKDSSTIIPGHGGVFDRFDSIIYSAPFIYLYLTYILF